MLQIEPVTVTDAIIRKLHELILSGQFKPGERLPSELQLAKEMGVSRASVREAVSALTALRLVRRSKRGTSVHPDAATLLNEPGASYLQQAFNARHIYEARRLIEPGIAHLAAQRSTPEDIAVCRASIERMQRTQRDPEAFIDADFDFHRAVARASRNEVLARLLETLLQLLVRSHPELAKMQRIPRTTERAIACHQELLEAIVARNGIRARRIGQRDLKAVEQMYLAYLASQPLGCSIPT
jgi:GntR family transcriptional repressor for pyruvate dehydrogenase complex